MNILKTLLCAIVLLGATNGYSQNCRYKIDKVDDFTGSKVLETKEKLLDQDGWGLSGAISVAARSVNGNDYLIFNILQSGLFSIDKGASMMLKSKTGYIIELQFTEYEISDPVGSSLWVMKSYLPVSESQMNEFEGFDVQKIRFYTTEGYIEKEIKSKRADVISNILSCLK